MKKKIVICIALALLLAGCTNTKYVATVGNMKLTESEMNFYLESVKEQMAGTELSNEEDWQTKEIEGRRAIELAKEKALEIAMNNLKYIEIGKAVGIKLTSEDKKDITTYKKQFKNQFGSDDNYKDYLKTNNIKDSFINMLCESMIYQSKLSEKIKKEIPVTEEDISNYFKENQGELNHEYRHAKHILILTKNMQTGEEFSEEKKEEARQKAEALLKRAKSGEDFDELAKEYSEDPGLDTHPDGYVFGDGEMVSEFQNGVDELDDGEIGFVESNFGYHILLKCPLTLDDIKDKILNLIIEERLNIKLSDWEKEYKINLEVNDEIMANIE